MEVRKGKPRKRGAKLARTDFRTKTPKAMSTILTGCWKRKATFSSIPMETKKKLANTSRNGNMLLMAWWLYSDSEMIRPARKAPKPSESPAMALTQAMERQITTTLNKKSSGMRVRVI